jgi:hypothetical protein
MERWQKRQQERLDVGHTAFQHHLPFATPTLPAPNEWEAAIGQARSEIRMMIELGEIAHDQITEGWIAEWAVDILHGAR